MVCIAIVAVAVMFHRRTGACGTSHYLIFQLLGGMLVSIVEDFWRSRYDALAGQVLAYLLNVGLFVLLIRLWHRKASERRYLLGLIALTAAYLCSYFFLLPTVDCP